MKRNYNCNNEGYNTDQTGIIFTLKKIDLSV